MRTKLDKLVVKRGLAKDLEVAKTRITNGEISVNGIVNLKSGSQVEPGADVKLTRPDSKYVSRGALKLEKGLEAFGLDPSGLVALDIGSSTGGFTDVLLQQGAKRVYAIDVGYGQLAWSLRNDERVVVLERENVRHLESEKIPDGADLAVIDVSFISLTTILVKVAALMGGGDKPIIALIKPQFEARREQVGEGGVVQDTSIREECIEKIRAWAGAQSFSVGEVVESPIRGPAGNVEFLIALRTPSLEK